MGVQLLTTKLYIPPVRPESVSRLRLVERLKAGLGRKLTLVSAPAGFGKTTLLSECVRTCGQPVAWVSLDKGDNDPTRFWTYCIAALQTIQADLGEATLALLRSSGITGATPLPPTESLLTGLINEIAEVPQPFTLILDDFHVITAQPVHDGLTFLLDNLPPHMHVVLAGRADPPWPLARLRARGEITELRAQDLRFTSEETADFLNDAMALGLSPQDVAVLEGQTEGWIVGLQMAALAIQTAISTQGRRWAGAGLPAADVSAFIKGFTGSHRFILDYLVEEVLQRQPENIQTFLLQTSILDRLCGPLCDAVLGDWRLEVGDWKLEVGDGSQSPISNLQSQDILEYLDHANLFVVPLDDERRWYRYHHLFAELLRSRLKQSQPDQMLALYRRASAWLEQNGLVPEAIECALAAGDVERVAHLVERNALATIYHRELATLMGWLKALPEEMVRSRPWLCIAHAWMLAFAGQFEALEARVQDAEQALARQALPDAEARRITGHICALRSYPVAVRADEPQAAALIRQALEHLSDEDWMVRGFCTGLLGSVLRWSGDFAGAIRAWAEARDVYQATDDKYGAVGALGARAMLQIEQGQLHAADATSREALLLVGEHARRGGRRLPTAGPIYARLSTLLREWNDVEGALRYAREAVETSKQWGSAEGLVTGHLTLARALQAAGDADGARDAMQMAIQVASQLSPWYSRMTAADQARLWLAQGNLAAAAQWAASRGRELDLDEEIRYLDHEEYIALARVLIAQGVQETRIGRIGRAAGAPQGTGEHQALLDEALGLLERLLKTLETTGAMGRVLEILVLQALAWQARGEEEQALAALKRALLLAEPEGYVRTFVDEGPPLDVLLRKAAARGIAPAYVSTLLAAFSNLQLPTSNLQLPTSNLQLPTSNLQLPTSNLQPPTSNLQLLEPLSEREMDVLRLLATSLSTPEIADELFVTPNTVRSHVKSIYSKLDAHNRMQAIQRAEELGLL